MVLSHPIQILCTFSTRTVYHKLFQSQSGSQRFYYVAHGYSNLHMLTPSSEEILGEGEGKLENILLPVRLCQLLYKLIPISIPTKSQLASHSNAYNFCYTPLKFSFNSFISTHLVQISSLNNTWLVGF